MHNVSVPIDKKLMKVYAKGYDRQRRRENLWSGLSFGTQLAGMGLQAWLANKQAETAMAVKQAQMAHDAALQQQQFAHDRSMVDARAEAEHAARMEEISARGELEAKHDQAEFERAQMETQTKARYDAFKPMLDVFRQKIGLRTASEEAQIANAEADRARARAYDSGRIGAGGASVLDPAEIPDSFVQDYITRHPGMAPDAARFAIAHGSKSDLMSDPGAKLTAAEQAMKFKGALQSAKTAEDRLKLRTQALSDIGVFFMRKGESGAQELDQQSYDSFLRSAGVDFSEPPAQVQIPQRDPTAPGPATQGGASLKAIPDAMRSRFSSLPPEEQQKALEGMKAGGFDVTPLMAQPSQPIVPPPASQPTSMGAPQMPAPNGSLFQPHELAAMYSAGQQHGIPREAVDAEIAKNPWGIRQALDSHVQGLLSQPQAPVA
jgi:hypothetical protein